METLNKDRTSITQTSEGEKYMRYCLGAFREQIHFQYDYRHADVELFSIVTRTLDERRKQWDEQIAKKEKKQ